MTYIKNKFKIPGSSKTTQLISKWKGKKSGSNLFFGKVGMEVVLKVLEKEWELSVCYFRKS